LGQARGHDSSIGRFGNVIALIDYDKTRFSSEKLLDLRLRSMRALKVHRALAGVVHAPGSRVLDLGCGEGALARTVKRLYPDAEVHGCDVSAAQLERARELGGAVEYRLTSASLPYDNGFFQAVFLLDVLEHVRNPEDLLRDVVRVLAPGGRLLMHCPCEGQPLTLHWLLWKLRLGAQHKRELVGHIQRLTHRRVLKMAAKSGLNCRRVRYQYHALGQLSDVLMFWKMWCLRRRDSGAAGRLERCIAAIPTFRFFRVMGVAGTYESRLLGRLPLAMGIDVTLVKDR
jgi:2-polyprenyl-3-methyl-5-hydroxy-6-metoxy-1,4-benzoquinol methylase